MGGWGLVVLRNRRIFTPRSATGGSSGAGFGCGPSGAFSGIEEEAFRAANVYGVGVGAPSTFKFSAISAYETVDIMDFIIMSLRNRARSDNTLSRVTKLMRDFIVFASSPDPPFPFHGGHR